MESCLRVFETAKKCQDERQWSFITVTRDRQKTKELKSEEIRDKRFGKTEIYGEAMLLYDLSKIETFYHDY